MFAYLATELSPNALDPDADEFLEIKKISVKEAYRMAYSGEIHDSKTLAALLLAQPFINK